jgi:hypothetical protein
MGMDWQAAAAPCRDTRGRMVVGVNPMSDISSLELRTEASELEWREAVIDLARAQRAYAQILAEPDAPEVLVNRLWLWLWRAERRRDELL